MTDEQFMEREMGRAVRLLKFVKEELREMWVDARFQFVLDLLNYLTPEVEEMVRQGQINVPTLVPASKKPE